MAYKERRVLYKRGFSFLGTLQYVLGFVIVLTFGIGLIPGYYHEVVWFGIGALVAQILISIFRFRLLNIFLEFFLLLLMLIGIIPYLGYFFRFLGFFFALLDLTSFKSSKLYKQIEIRTFSNMPGAKGGNEKKRKGKSKENVYDADYKEK